jgi:hypothetical protein
MIDNIDKVLERGDRLDLLVDKTTTMQGNTVRFKRQARRYRSTTWWRNVKLTYVNSLSKTSYNILVCIFTFFFLFASWSTTVMFVDFFAVVMSHPPLTWLNCAPYNLYKVKAICFICIRYFPK